MPLYRYTLPAETFQWVGPDGGPGNYISRSPVT